MSRGWQSRLHISAFAARFKHPVGCPRVVAHDVRRPRHAQSAEGCCSAPLRSLHGLRQPQPVVRRDFSIGLMWGGSWAAGSSVRNPTSSVSSTLFKQDNHHPLRTQGQALWGKRVLPLVGVVVDVTGIAPSVGHLTLMERMRVAWLAIWYFLEARKGRRRFRAVQRRP